MKGLRTFRAFLIISFTASALITTGCRLTPEEEAVIDYHSRTVDYLTSVGSGAASRVDLERTKIFDNTGYQVGEIVQTYDADGLNTRTDVYGVDVNGTKNLHEYYLNTYDSVDYPAGTTAYRLIKSETFDSGGTRQAWSSYAYHAAFQDSLTEKTDYVLDGEADKKVGYQLRTYLTDTVNTDKNGKYRTDQVYSYDTDGVTLKLKKETAAWYDDDGTLTSELYHVVRGSTTDTVLPNGAADEAYYYVTYSRSEQGLVYLKSSYVYYHDAAEVLVWDDGPDGSFSVIPANNDPFAYALEFSRIKNQYDLIISDYDGEGNLLVQTLYVFGVIQNRTTYGYNDNNDMVERSRYGNGGIILEEKVVVRFREEEIDGVTYTIRETFTYYFNEDLQPSDTAE